DLDGGLPKNPPLGPKYKLDDLPANKRSDPPLRLPVTMPPLSARYFDMLPVEKVKQVTVNFSGIAPNADFDVDALLDIKDKGWERRQLVHGDTHFCLTDPPDAVQEFIIVLSNHDAAANVSGEWTVQSLAEPCGAWDVV